MANGEPFTIKETGNALASVHFGESIRSQGVHHHRPDLRHRPPHGFELAKHGTVVLVGRDRRKLDEVQKAIEQKRQHAVSVVCDVSDIASVRRAAAEIIALHLPIVGLLNNAGIMQMRATKNALGWDMTFATNQLGPFALTEALVPHLPDGANVLFVVSAVEDPERKPAVASGFRGGRYISVEASAARRLETRRLQDAGL